MSPLFSRNESLSGAKSFIQPTSSQKIVRSTQKVS